MALNAEGIQATTNESGGARRFALGSPVWTVSSPGDFRARPQTALQRTIEIAPGMGQCCGVLVEQTSSTLVTVEQNTTSSDRWDVVCVAVAWGNGTVGASSVDVVVRKGAGPTLPTPIPALVRNPGVAMDCPVAIVRVPPQASVINARDIYPTCPYGGSGGLHIAGSNPTQLLAEEGTTVIAEGDSSTWQYRSGAWKVISRPSVPWQLWAPNPQSSAGAVNLGNGGSTAGRYKVFPHGEVICEFEIRTGVDAFNWGWGTIGISLPVAASSDYTVPFYQPIHMLTKSGNEGPMDWKCQARLSPSSTYVGFMAPTHAQDNRLKFMRAADSSGRPLGTGVPGIPNFTTEPSVITGTLQYRI